MLEQLDINLTDLLYCLADRLMSQDPDDFQDLLGRVKRVGVSVSLDCCIKFWHLDSGNPLSLFSSKLLCLVLSTTYIPPICDDS